MKVRKMVSLFIAILLTIIVSSTAAENLKPPAEVNQNDLYVILGAYDQTFADENNLGVDNGTEPIEWIVLDQDGTKLLLLSKEPLDYQQYIKENRDKYSWEFSSIRSWLNSTFIQNAFTPEEADAILSTDVETKAENIEKDWPQMTTEKTTDKIFLLSHTEYNKYLQSDKINVNQYVDKNDGLPLTKDDSWWLRSSGKRDNEACYVGHGRNESGWLTDWRCIRPAMWIDTSLFDWNNSRYTQSKQASQLAAEKKYTEAYAITDTLGDYWNSTFLSLFYRYEYAKETENGNDFAEAISRYQDAKDYIDSHFTDDTIKANLKVSLGINPAILENKYLLAIQTKENGDIEKAIEMFTDIGQYKDSMQNLRSCFDKMHIQYSWLPSDAVNTGHDTGFKDTKAIDGNDPHFGWSLGRFMMSGFTEEKRDGSRTVFMKTPGDSLILWFNLDQDINALNGHKDLWINNDTNGYDVGFQYSQQKDGVGKGLLLIRHTDFRNSTTAPQAYTNFLVANDDTGANTKVEIKEEGIYDVALDYEIQKDELFDKFFNYRIAFSFEVRNGSGMFFLFDTETGSELQDYSRTSEGFRIDLANSHSLSVSYTRYAMNQEETGLDVRKTGLAQDGDEFDKVGYYEIKVTNKETNEELIKHIFVGRSADLAEYQAVDESLSKFSK